MSDDISYAVDSVAQQADQQKTILLVEDQPIIARMNAEIVRGFGYHVIEAYTGEAAVEAIGKTPVIDLVLMDVDLGPGIDGTEAARQILASKCVPIVFLTSHAEQDYVERVRKITRYGYVIKNSGEFVLQSSIAMAFELFEANQKALAARAQLEATLNALPDLLIEIDGSGVCLDFHSPVGDGYPLINADYIGRNLSETMPAESTDVIMSAVAEAETSGTSFGKSFALFNGDKTRWFEISVAKKPIEPELSHYVVLRRDITERMRVEEELRTHQVELQVQGEEVRTQHDELEEHRNKYFNLYEFSPVSIISFSDSGIIKEINLTGASQLQSTRSGLIGQLITKIISPANQDVFYLARKRLLASAENGAPEPRETFSLTLMRADKTVFATHAQLSFSQVNSMRGSFFLVVMPLTEGQ